MNIDVSNDVFGTSTVDEWKIGNYSHGQIALILNTDHIVHMEETKLKTYPTTAVILSDDRVVILSKSLLELKSKFHVK
jgi:hypothetical protein